MTDEDARHAVEDDVPRETFERLSAFVAIIDEGRHRQNLIAPSTFDTIWMRHILDSIQLLRHAPPVERTWIDVGSGAGFPGIVVAIVTGKPTILVESRRLRTAFLTEAAARLNLPNVRVITANVEQVDLPPAGILSARAVAALPKLFASMRHLADADTTWLLPKGRSAASELAEARRTWHGDFIMQPSITDPDAAIIVARNVASRATFVTRGDRRR